ncbi:MAG: transcription termination/antitermination protein NusA [Actinobacteria bacterium]|nr:transcription termination/antitermination protein NusA [Actinomycetota bacterium]
MNAEMIAALRELEREKGIAFETILSGLEEAMASAYKAHWKQEHPEGDDEFVGFRAVIDPETGDLRMWQQELEEVDTPPVEGSDEPGLEMKVISEAEVEVTDDFKGRIGAQTAKQVIFQKLRDAEREMTYEEFAGREGDVVTGIVQQQERRYTLLDLGKVEALLPQGEQVPSEPLRHGERLKAFITEVRRGTKGPQIVVSRTHPGLLKALFALEVPEINEGIVEIMAVAREPGHRSKIAVASNEPAVDPVGACVGPKGSRVRMVVNELRGEKIDVVPWSDESATFVANALQPAKVKEVTVNPETQTALVIVPDYQLSLAIGREGQNARLAARLTGWRIDIKSESQAAEPPAPAVVAPPVVAEEVPAAPEEAPAAPSDAQEETEEEVATGAGAEPTPEEVEPVEAEPVAAEVPVEAAPAEAPAGE